MALIDSFLGWAAIYPLRIACLVVPPLCLLFNLQPVHAKVGDVVAYFGAYYVWAVLFGLWISNGRTQPILTEVWQLLAAPGDRAGGLRGPDAAEGPEIRRHRQGRRPQQRLYPRRQAGDLSSA